MKAKLAKVLRVTTIPRFLRFISFYCYGGKFPVSLQAEHIWR